MNCDRVQDLKIADIRAYIKKRGWDIKARSKVELCNGIKKMRAVARAQKKAAPRPLSSARIKKMYSNCKKNTLCENRIQTKRANVPASEIRKADFCKALKQYYKKIPRIQKIASKCSSRTRDATTKSAQRVRLGTKTLHDFIKGRVAGLDAKAAQCAKLGALHRIKK